MKTLTKLILVTLSIFYLCSCTTLSKSEKTTLRELRTYGIMPNEIKVKEPAVAGALNILPGVGNFYLAIGTDESSQWMYGTLNLLVWPFSIVWGIPAAAIDADTINKKETVYHYTYDRLGKSELEEIKKKYYIKD